VGNNNIERIRLLIELSDNYLNVDTGKSKSHALEALHLAQNAKSEVALAAVYNTLGNCYRVTNNPYRAHVNYRNAEKLFLKHHDSENLYKIYNNLLLLFLDLEDAENVAYYAGKLQELAAEQNDLSTEIQALFLLGWARFEDKEGDEAMDFFLNMYKKSLPLNATITHFIAVHCGNILIMRNQPGEALKYLLPALKYFEDEGTLVMPELYGYLAESYTMINRVDSAEFFIEKAQNSPLVTDDTRLILYRSRSALDYIKGDHKSALTFYKLYHNLSDSIAKTGRTTEMARIKLWHEFDQKELEKTLLQQDYEKQRKFSQVLSIAMAIILALLALTIYFYRKIIESNRVLNDKNHEMEELHSVKDKLFSVVAHDLRGPIATLMAVLNLSRSNTLDAATQAQLLIDASKRVDDVNGLLDNLLRWAKSQMQGLAASPVYFNAQEGSNTVTNPMQNVAVSKKIALDDRIGNHQIYADRDMFATVVRNLTANAIKYTSAGGEVTLSSHLVDDMLVISVMDSGTGMPPEVQNKLFKLSVTKSQRGTDNEAGTGLGLVLCADFVKANGGKIWFNSVPGEGSTFYFSVPVKS